MKTFNYYFTLLVCYSTALLFIYAATSKLLDFENFRVQLGQSTLLSAFAGWISILVPLIELGIAFLLLNHKFRSTGIVLAFLLMVMFSAYIYIILNYSSFVPCSCGGVLEKMTWGQHLVFNIVVTVLLGLALFTTPVYKQDAL